MPTYWPVHAMQSFVTFLLMMEVEVVSETVYFYPVLEVARDPKRPCYNE